MKRFALLLTTIFLLSTAPAFAHCGSCGIGDAKGSKDGDGMKKKMEMMTEMLGLDEEQAKKIEAIKKEKHEKIKAIKDEYMGKIKAVLNDDQKVKFDEMKKGSMKGSMKERKGSEHEHKGSH